VSKRRNQKLKLKPITSNVKKVAAAEYKEREE
jgi:hypothetical protein